TTGVDTLLIRAGHVMRGRRTCPLPGNAYTSTSLDSTAAALLPCLSTTDVEDTVVVKITPNEKNNPPGKLADAELHFSDGVLGGLKLMGFAVWERRTGNGRNVTFPAR